MISIFIILLVLVAILLMGVILIQSSKGGGLAGTFGGGGGADASMVFGVRRTADFLIKLTSILATVLLLFSLITNVLINKSGGTNESIIQQNSGQQNFPQPNVPNEMQQPQQQDPNQQQQQQPVDPNQQPPK
ncbi:MAG TPA: preprotein translocase subunit SecG [Ignavibacteria bacterium]|nr:preprotein translocase subunit SecG [Bacteroidota bacterium]HRF64913.1 preprotein translocase subunit SecG [Ignavibacteria bacterium]HRJ04674.1 preprotein translocase subunit SecG [Ignavibacteria bacterium]HRJ85049.1 preprotein translocase subunit SecG [Ignavibacteria bacterium]